MKTGRMVASNLAALMIASSVSAQKPMNFVVIFSDELPPEYVGAYGGEKYPTPNLDRLAADGMRFNNGFSTAPMCTPARYAIQTGRYPSRCAGLAAGCPAPRPQSDRGSG